jgi:hypothetical protein
MYTTICHDLCYAKKAWPSTLVDPCYLSGPHQKKRDRGNGKVVISAHVGLRRCSCGQCLTSGEIISNSQKGGIASSLTLLGSLGGGGGGEGGFSF